jgi:tripartite-type tricarboxylate transporter receptor subunit TctC
MRERILAAGRAATLALVIGVAGLLPPATAWSAEFYQGKTVTFIAATDPGGGTDNFARLTAKYLTKHVPGNPNIIVQNMPGGSSVVGANYVYVKAKPDGLSVLVASGSNLIAAQRLGQSGVQYDMSLMHMIVGSATADVCLVAPETGVQKPQDITAPKTELIRSALGRTNDTSVTSDITMEELLKVKQYRAVYGYAGAGPARLAFMRSESNMYCDSTLSYSTGQVQQMLQEGKAIPVFQSGIMGGGGKMFRHPSASTIPTVEELYQQLFGKAPSGVAWEAYRNQIAVRTFSKVIALAPESPKEAVDAFEAGIRVMVKDPEWAEESQKATGEALLPPLMVIGDDAQQQVKSFLAESVETSKWFDNFVNGKK